MYILGPNLEPVFFKLNVTGARNLETVSSEFYDKNWYKKVYNIM